MFFLSQSMENLYGPGSEGSPPSVEEIEEGECLWGMGAARTGVVAIGTEHCPLIGCLPPKEVDILLQRCEGGVDAALQYAKDMAKYMKDLISYLDKRTTLGEGRGDTRTGLGGVLGKGISEASFAPPSLAEMEFAKGLQKVVHSCRQSITHAVGWAKRVGNGYLKDV